MHQKFYNKNLGGDGWESVGVGFNGRLWYVAPVATQVKNGTKPVQSIFFQVKNLNQIQLCFVRQHLWNFLNIFSEQINLQKWFKKYKLKFVFAR